MLNSNSAIPAPRAFEIINREGRSPSTAPTRDAAGRGSISGNTADDLPPCVRQVSVEGVAAIEGQHLVPESREDGKAFAIRPGSTFEVMRKLRQATHLPLWAKLTPNTGETSEVARAAEEGGADALVVAKHACLPWRSTSHKAAQARQSDGRPVGAVAEADRAAHGLSERQGDEKSR